MKYGLAYDKNVTPWRIMVMLKIYATEKQRRYASDSDLRRSYSRLPLLGVGERKGGSYLENDFIKIL